MMFLGLWMLLGLGSAGTFIYLCWLEGTDIDMGDLPGLFVLSVFGPFSVVFMIVVVWQVALQWFKKHNSIVIIKGRKKDNK